MKAILKNHLTPLTILSIILVLAALINVINPGEGWGYVSAMVFGIAVIVLQIIHIGLNAFLKSKILRWLIELTIMMTCLIYAQINGLLKF